jgi:tol-pal system protein YbgF
MNYSFRQIVTIWTQARLWYAMLDDRDCCSAMIRSAFLCVAVLACALGMDGALAQESDTELVTRINRLEAAIRNLTGTVEQLQYRNQQLELQVQRLMAQSPGGPPVTSAVPPRPPATPNPATQNPTAQYPPPATMPAAPVVAAVPPVEPVAPPPSGGRRGDAFDPTLNPNAPGAPRPLGTSTAATEPPPPISDAAPPGQRQIGAPLDLSTPPAGATGGGSLPAPPPVNTSSTGAMQPTLPPSNSPKDEYDLAYGYILRRDYPLAANAFRVFLRQYPSDRQAPEALYWLGESLFQQQQYRDAAESFLAVSTKYDTSLRAPEALLRLGQSLAALGEKEAACASLAEVLRKYPRASPSVKQSVERDQKRVHC